MRQIKSKQRVAEHGEVFTPPHIVDAMLDLVKDETLRIDSRFLEPACGRGNFLIGILQRKLDAVQNMYSTGFEIRHFSLLAVMSMYGIELLADNIAECRQNVLEVLVTHLELDGEDPLLHAASYVLSQNLIHGDALTMKTVKDSADITFAEWEWLGKGKYRRRDFRYDGLKAVREEGELFPPDKVYPKMTMLELAELGGNNG